MNILSTNACDLKNKAEDLKNKVRYFNSAVFSVQETHFGKKVKFRMKDYIIFESIRKNKEKGGTLLGIQIGLKPVLVKEYNKAFELLIIEVKIAN